MKKKVDRKGTYTRWYREYYHRKGHVYHQELYQENKKDPDKYKELRERQVNNEYRYSQSAKGLMRNFRRYKVLLDFEVEQLQAILDGSCYWCGAEVNTIVKLESRGELKLYNLVGYCQCCNKMKPVDKKKIELEEEEVV